MANWSLASATELLKDVCKCDLKNLSIRTDKWDLLANDRAKSASTIHKRPKKRVKEYFKKLKKMKK